MLSSVNVPTPSEIGFFSILFTKLSQVIGKWSCVRLQKMVQRQKLIHILTIIRVTIFVHKLENDFRYVWRVLQNINLFIESLQ